MPLATQTIAGHENNFAEKRSLHTRPMGLRTEFIHGGHFVHFIGIVDGVGRDGPAYISNVIRNGLAMDNFDIIFLNDFNKLKGIRIHNDKYLDWMCPLPPEEARRYVKNHLNHIQDNARNNIRNSEKQAEYIAQADAYRHEAETLGLI